MSEILLTLTLGLFLQQDDALSWTVVTKKGPEGWIVTIEGRGVPAKEGGVLDLLIKGRRERWVDGKPVSVAVENPIRRKVRVAGGRVSFTQDFSRLGVYELETILPSFEHRYATIRIGSPQQRLAEAALQVRKSEDWVERVGGMLQEVDEALASEGRVKAAKRWLQRLYEMEGKLIEYSAGTYHPAAMDELAEVLRKAGQVCYWVGNTDQMKGADDYYNKADGRTGTPDPKEDLRKVSLAEERERVKGVPAVIARETALLAAGEYVEALRAWRKDSRPLESFLGGLLTARGKLGEEFAQEIDLSEVTLDNRAARLKAAEALESALRQK